MNEAIAMLLLGMSTILANIAYKEDRKIIAIGYFIISTYCLIKSIMMMFYQ